MAKTKSVKSSPAKKGITKPGGRPTRVSSRTKPKVKPKEK